MSELLAGIGIALVFEGMLWALAPDTARRMLAELSTVPNSRLQPLALVIVALGVGLFWLAKG
ncbi:MAG: DUF2065 domain-containing protein [Hyphomicrobium sp.]|nr:DUF2065 domain-containing protein [Hyphomicrobium sp.]